MMKKLILALMFCLPMTIMGQSLKIGYFKSEHIISLMPEYTKAQTELDVLQQQLTNEIKTMTTTWQQQYEEFLKLQANTANPLPQNISDRRQKEIEDTMQRIQAFEAEARKMMETKSQELMSSVQHKLKEAVEVVVRAGGFLFICDLSTASSPYINESMSIDVTAEVKTQLGIQ
jgi:outer membrane protein